VLLSLDYTCMRMAVLTDDVIEQIISRYGGYLGLYNEYVRSMNRRFEERFPGKGDLLTEWEVKSISQGYGSIADFDDFEEAARWFFAHSKEPKFKKLLTEMWPQHSEIKGFPHKESYNPRNILDFNVVEILELMKLYDAVEIHPRTKALLEKIPEGASVLYNDGINQVVSVTDPQAACTLGAGTKWCTSDAETARDYLDKSPLFVLYKNGKKYGQMHMGDGVDPETIQLRNLQNRELPITHEVRSVLIKSGLMEEIFKILSRASGSSCRQRWII